jgi:hypothetical protein
VLQCADAASAGERLRRMLAPVARAAATAAGGTRARDSALLFGAAHVTRARAADAAAHADAAAAAAAAWRARAGAAAHAAHGSSSSSGGGGGGGGGGAAWAHFGAAGLPLEAQLLEAVAALRAADAASAPALLEPCSPAECAWLEEGRAARRAATHLARSLHALVSAAQLAPLRACLAACAAAAAAMAEHAEEVAAAAAWRARWVATLAEAPAKAPPAPVVPIAHVPIVAGGYEYCATNAAGGALLKRHVSSSVHLATDADETEEAPVQLVSARVPMPLIGA